ncbi:MAG: hypothetical protein FWE41_06180 [Coriobacteriia bacterium]|nr:hypothetical protein [Coriobacteriia bacterium]MCL2750023.1 hypothetical protein [Coriobacteriia bacterium]
MKIKHSLAALTLVTTLSATLPVAAFATAANPTFTPANEQLDFSPLVYALVLLTAILFCLIVVLSFQVHKLRQNQKLIGRGLYEINNSVSASSLEPIFDYSQIETPEEFILYSEQSFKTVEDAIIRLTTKKAYVPKHQRREEPVIEADAKQPHIRLLPEMKYARRKAAHAAAPEIPAELEELVRKIS